MAVNDLVLINQILERYIVLFPNTKEPIKDKQNKVKAYSARLVELGITPYIVSTAMMKIMETSTFFPPFCDILDVCRMAIHKINNTGVKDYNEAWDEVWKAARVGKIPPEGWSSPQIKKAVEYMGGLTAIINAPAGSTVPLRAQFRDCYKTVCRRKENDDGLVRAMSYCCPPEVLKKINAIGQIEQTGTHNDQ